MKTNELNLSAKTLARTTGFFYLLIITGGLISGMFVRGTLIDLTNAEITLNNIIQNEALFRLGFLGDLIMVLSDVMVSVLFYFLLVNVHKGLAILAAVFRLLQSSVLGANLINLFKPVVMIQGAEKMSTEQLTELSRDVMTQMQVFDYGYLISGVFFAINCLLMGVLLYKSADFPKFIGIMIFIAGLGYMFNSMASFLVPSLIEISAMVMLFTAVIAELTFCAYLLTAGVRNKSKESQP
ncbi:DUF4386 domain-containing protein [Lentimicrobium sp.]|uniref:DUF4386 domain-containing protein n=1 Tax=Lentimicrobium sp. TaxID=2034841 RepID=UPI0025E940AF|nr:DUF4386 domain-containing protein [Lentimicrobium sp.]MCO5255210.1 DUF4386 domain-containing protein [Lentimicrobium sp.]HOP12612.1 DUF4386 domain-containing protein [Lentimicrobium sp.]HPF63399.1 DUF4386 domain-containing protein [Lentimicrobium sp.]HPR25993.1 DUF4386 domain-containing protein [Lentimicrobium sp.]